MINTIKIKKLTSDELNDKSIEIGKQLDGLSVNQANYILQRLKQDMNLNSYIKYSKVLGISQHSKHQPKKD